MQVRVGLGPESLPNGVASVPYVPSLIHSHVEQLFALLKTADAEKTPWARLRRALIEHGDDEKSGQFDNVVDARFGFRLLLHEVVLECGPVRAKALLDAFSEDIQAAGADRSAAQSLVNDLLGDTFYVVEAKQ